MFSIICTSSLPVPKEIWNMLLINKQGYSLLRCMYIMQSLMSDVSRYLVNLIGYTHGNRERAN